MSGRWNLALKITVQASLACVYANWCCSKYPLHDKPLKDHMQGAEFVLILLTLPHRSLDHDRSESKCWSNSYDQKQMWNTCVVHWLTPIQSPWGNMNICGAGFTQIYVFKIVKVYNWRAPIHYKKQPTHFQHLHSVKSQGWTSVPLTKNMTTCFPVSRRCFL